MLMTHFYTIASGSFQGEVLNQIVVQEVLFGIYYKKCVSENSGVNDKIKVLDKESFLFPPSPTG